jgi:hypothetical protein
MTATHAARAEDTVPVHVDYEASSGCPDAEAFARQVLARAPRARLALPAEPARKVVARVRTSNAHAFEGQLVVREPGAASSERTVRAASCEELVTALAVIAAVVIDPLTARTGAVDASPPPGDATAPPDDVAAVLAPPTPTPTPTAPPAAPEAAPGALPPGQARPWAFSAGGGGGLVAGSAPTVLLSVPLFVEIARDGRALVSPSLRLRFERTSTSSNSEGGAFVRTGGAADLCPVAVRGRSLRAQPCLRTELAALYAKGRGVDPVRSDVRPWLAVGAVARVRLELAGPLFVELEAALLAAAVRDRFYVEPFAVVYRPPALGGTAAFAVGAAF